MCMIYSADYFNINVGTIQDIHKCFMKKNNIKYCSGVLKKCLLHYYYRFGESLVSNSKRPKKCVSLKNEPSQPRP